MTRPTFLGLAAGAALVALLGLRLMSSPPTRPSATAAGAGDSIHDLMMDLLIIPLDRRPAKPFALARLDGREVALADLEGRPALLYFWATW